MRCPRLRAIRARTVCLPWCSFISENPIVAKIQYWMKITFVFILILFIDSVNRVYRVQLELLAATEQTSKGAYVTLSNPLIALAHRF